MSVEIISVGNELLIGKTLNTNAQWLAKRISVFGLRVRRITTVGDELEEISSVLLEVLGRKPSFVVMTGGLGPTFDDKTLEGVARALGCELEVNEEAMRMIKEKYKRYRREGRIRDVELTSYRVKMARLPEIAEPIPNPIGTAPGVKIERGESVIIILPGVPQEMKAIFDQSVAPLMREAAVGRTYFETELISTGVGESDLAPLIDQVMSENPYVYVKSHPKASEAVLKVEFHLSTTAESTEAGRTRIARALIQLSELIEEKGGKVTLLGKEKL